MIATFVGVKWSRHDSGSHFLKANDVRMYFQVFVGHLQSPKNLSSSPLPIFKLGVRCR